MLEGSTDNGPGTNSGANTGGRETDTQRKIPSTKAIQDWLVTQLSRLLEVEPQDLDIREPFTNYGLRSVDAVGLSGDLEDWLDRRLSPTLAYDYPTIESLARHLAGESEVSADRWDINAFYDANPGIPGKMSTRWGGFLERVDLFDPHFFGIFPREAGRMDPQQRLLLEVAWEALEDAGQAPQRLAGSRTGGFIGISSSDYSQLQIRHGNYPFDIDAYAGTG